MARAIRICSNLIAGGALAAALLAGTFTSAQQVSEASADERMNFSDPADGLNVPQGPALQFSASDGLRNRFNHPVGPVLDSAPAPRRLELELAAGGAHAPVDVSISQRASVNADDAVDQRGSGSELRIGRGLVRERNSGGADATYVFVASDNEALTWQPGARNGPGGLAMQDQVQVGDMAAGVTIERNGVQASVAYVERSEQTRVGVQTYSQDQSFTGVTVTMPR